MEAGSAGKKPVGGGWFVVSAREAPWVYNEKFGAGVVFEGAERFSQLGINIQVMSPGQPNGYYHAEEGQEDFLVLSGECLLLVDGQERHLKAWDFVHCPPWTEHIFVGAGEGPFVMLAVGARSTGDGLVYPVSEGKLADGQQHEVSQDRARPVRLALLSFLMLFLELMLIRWGAANVLYLAYFANFVLLASFLGIGVAFLRASARRDHFAQSPIALAILIGFIALFPAQIDHGRHVAGLFGSPALPIWLSLPLIFGLVTAAMALVAEGAARIFATFSPLAAYRLDILGSLLGIVGFTALS